MTPEERDALKSLIRQEPTLAATFAEVDVEYAKAKAYLTSIEARHIGLSDQLAAIEAAKQQLSAAYPVSVQAEPDTTQQHAEEQETGEPDSHDSPADKPTESESDEQ